MALDQTGALVWSVLDGSSRLDEIVADLADVYGVPARRHRARRARRWCSRSAGPGCWPVSPRPTAARARRRGEPVDHAGHDHAGHDHAGHDHAGSTGGTGDDVEAARPV